jgi:nicotinamide-nucleotide amidase
MPDQPALDAAKALLDICSRKKLTLATAESCTGGLVAATISEIPGSSAHASVDLAVSITGIAGPTGAVPGKPIGLVYFCAASRSGRVIAHDRKYGDVGRTKVRELSVLQALSMLHELADKEEPRPPAGKS